MGLIKWTILRWGVVLHFIITSPARALRSIVMSASVCAFLFVCVSVCLSARISPEPHARSLLNFLCMLPIAVARSSFGEVMQCQREGAFGGFLPHWQCIVHHSIWDPYENGWTDRDAVRDNNLGGPLYHVLDGAPNALRGRSNFWKKRVGPL